MKKNEKGFMQDEANLEKVAGGIGGVEVETDIKTGDIGYKSEEANKTETNTTTQQDIKFGNVSGGVNNVNFTNTGTVR